MRKGMLLLIAAMVISMLAFFVTAAVPFTDVSEGAWYYADVEYAYDNGLMDGTAANQFSPRGIMSRAMLATVLYRMSSSVGKAYPQVPFPDTASGKWYYDAVCWAYAEGIVMGTPDGLFCPNDEVKRQDAACMIERFLTAEGVALRQDQAMIEAFADAGKIGSYAAQSVERLRQAGIFAGDANGNFNPRNSLSRAEGAALLNRLHRQINGQMPEVPETVAVIGLGDLDSAGWLPLIP